ncbi:MAG: hypothetical protein Q9217_001053 [Psora testacea]
MLQTSVSTGAATTSARPSWSAGLTWSEYMHSWGWAFAQDLGIGGVGLLALLTGPLAWGLFWYHIYLIWAGVTTNETSKWADWKDDITDGFVFSRRKGQVSLADSHRDTSIEPAVDWPIRSTHALISRPDGQPPESQYGNGEKDKKPSTRSWTRVKSLQEIENIYDRGFWDNLLDILP